MDHEREAGQSTSFLRDTNAESKQIKISVEGVPQIVRSPLLLVIGSESDFLGLVGQLATSSGPRTKIGKLMGSGQVPPTAG